MARTRQRSHLIQTSSIHPECHPRACKSCGGCIDGLHVRWAPVHLLCELRSRDWYNLLPTMCESSVDPQPTYLQIFMKLFDNAFLPVGPLRTMDCKGWQEAGILTKAIQKLKVGGWLEVDILVLGMAVLQYLGFQLQLSCRHKP